MSSIIFYGAGQNARENIEKWIDEGIVPLALADYDEKKANTFFETKSGHFEILSLEQAISRYPDYELYVTLTWANALNAVEYLTAQGIPKERIKYFFELNSSMSLSDIQQTATDNGLFGEILADAFNEKYAVLFDFAEQLKHNANFESIEISDGKLVGKMRQYPVKFNIPPRNLNSVAGSCACKMPIDLFTAKLVQLFLDKKCIIDIGANIGFYSCLAGKLNPSSEVHSFEPIPNTFKILNENIKLNGLTNVTTNCTALSDKQSNQGIMHYNPNDEGSQSLAFTRDDGSKKDVTVVLGTLDNYIENNNLAPDFIKVDTEGHELHVLKGGERTLRKHKPIIISETVPEWLGAFGNTGQELFDFLSGIGYSIFKIDKTELIEVDKTFPVNHESNYVFMVKPENDNT